MFNRNSRLDRECVLFPPKNFFGLSSVAAGKNCGLGGERWMVGGRLSVVASLRGVSQAIKPTPSSSVASSESQVFHPIICDVQFIMIKGQGELGYELMRV